MAETISGQAHPAKITEYAFCIFVNLSRVVDIDEDKRPGIVKVFQEEFEAHVSEVQDVRFVAKGSGITLESSGWVDAQEERETTPQQRSAAPAPVPVPPVQVPSTIPDFGIAPPEYGDEYEEESEPVVQPSPQPRPPAPTAEASAVETVPIPEPVHDGGSTLARGESEGPDRLKPIILPVIDKREAVRPTEEARGLELDFSIEADGPALEPVKLPPVISSAPSTPKKGPEPIASKPVSLSPVNGQLASKSPEDTTTPREGTPENPIKLTREMLSGSVIGKEEEKLKKGIKIVRVKGLSKLSLEGTELAGGRPAGDSNLSGQLVQQNIQDGLQQELERFKAPAPSDVVLLDFSKQGNGDFTRGDMETPAPSQQQQQERPAPSNPFTLSLDEPARPDMPHEMMFDLLQGQARQPPMQGENISPNLFQPQKPQYGAVKDAGQDPALTLNLGDRPATTGASSQSEGKQCPRCGRNNNQDDRFCVKCRFDFSGQEMAGTTSPGQQGATPRCPQCNAQLKPDARFCNKCGTRVA